MPATFAIVPDRLVNPNAGTTLQNQAVIVESSRIVSVESNTSLPATLATFEFPDCTLLPGLIDAHVHLCMNPDSVMSDARTVDPARLAIQGAANALATLQGGVTTVRCVGTAANVDLVIRDAVRAGQIPGPDIVAAGRVIAMTGGHGHQMAIEADGVASIVQAVREQVKSGADVIKLMVTGGVLTPGGRPGMPQLLPEELHAAITVAHRAGRRVCGHAEGPEGVRDAVVAGIDSIEHGYFVADDPLFAAMQEHPTWLVPTLVAYAAILDLRDSLPLEAVTNAELAIERHRESFRHALAAGIPIAMGSDAGTPGNPHGENWREVVHMVSQGMAVERAIHAATVEAARLLGLADTGAIEPGYAADLLVVAGDPMADVMALGQTRAVWKAGASVALPESRR